MGTTEYEWLGGECCILLEEVAPVFLIFNILRCTDATHTPFRDTDFHSVYQMLINILRSRNLKVKIGACVLKERIIQAYNVKVKQSYYRTGHAVRVPGG